MIDETLADGERRMRRAVEVLKEDLATVRTGRASPSLIEGVTVEYYGTPTPLQQLAAINVADARQLVIQPYDRTAIKEIDRAILKANLGLTATNDGVVLRINVPSLTEERRKEMVKMVHKKVEEHKVAVRNGRRDVADHLKSAEKAKSISADELKRAEERLQKLTDRTIAEMDTLGRDKEKEVLAV
ncbi:MAG: ribosome recycling factor [Chloroflexota bacterium]